MDTLAIVQARMGSNRLPGKALKKVCNLPLIQILFERLNQSKKINKLILATTTKKEDDILEKLINRIGFDVYRGSEKDVLDRYFNAAINYCPKNIVRITGDCPLVDPDIVDGVIDLFLKTESDYCSNVIPPSFPDGLDVEVFKMEVLKKAHTESVKPYHREHVTTYIIEDKTIKKTNYFSQEDFSDSRWTVDYEEDLNVVENIFNFFSPDIHFSSKNIYNLQKKEPTIFLDNKKFKRNQETKIGTGQKLYKRAKEIIPGGTMLLSKRPEMFLPDLWPSYYSKAKGCYIWDLDEKKYLDLSIMGIGTNILGYANDEVDEAVIETIHKSNMSTFNCPEEVELAEKLIQIHPWAGMARFARSGGEANSIAIRIARAASGKDNVAICGYHGWHDWYLSSNIANNTNLDNHLLTGLDPKGIPKVLRNTTFPFKYNDFEGLNNIVKTNDIGVIKMEVSRFNKPIPGFLESIRKLADQNNIILIFDECTSGFRQTFGGLHKLYGVEPDIAMFGKALGNGYAITAIIGKSEIMDFAQTTFISSTFWTERIGPTAALKTLDIMEREKSWNLITNVGKSIEKRWTLLAEKYDLPILIGGIPSLINFSLKTKNWVKYKTYITQEMLKKNILATNMIYVCLDHAKEDLGKYFYYLESLFIDIKEFEEGKNIDDHLDGPQSHTSFERVSN